MVRRRSGLRFASTTVLSFILFLAMMVLITGTILLGTALNPLYAVRQLERSGFADLAAYDLREVYISYGLASGVSREFMAELITTGHVEYVAERIIMEAFGEGPEYSFENYSDEVYHALYGYAVAQGIEITAEVETGLRGLAELCADALMNYIDSPIFRVPAQARQSANLLLIAMAGSTIAGIAAAVVILAVNRRVTRWIDGYLYALSATAIMCIALPAGVFATGITRRLQISPLSYNRFITSWVEGILSGYLAALIPLTILIGVCIAVRVIRWKKRR